MVDSADYNLILNNIDAEGANTLTKSAVVYTRTGASTGSKASTTSKDVKGAELLKAAPAKSGSITVDTGSYIMAPGNKYDIKITATGDAKLDNVKVTDSRTGSIMGLTRLGAGKYRVTGYNEGTAFLKISYNGEQITTVRVEVKKGVKASGTDGKTVDVGIKAVGACVLDTASYSMAPGNQYDIKVSVGGSVKLSDVRVTDSRSGSVFSLVNLGSGKYRITGVNEGTAYVKVACKGQTVTMRVDVKKGVKASGETGPKSIYLYE